MSVNKIQGGQGQDYKIKVHVTNYESGSPDMLDLGKIGLSSQLPAVDKAKVTDPRPVGTVHSNVVVMRNNLQTYTGVGQVPADSAEEMNTYEDVWGEKEEE